MLSRIIVITSAETTGIDLANPPAPTGNPLDQTLSDRGVKQAELLATKYAKGNPYDITHVYSSGYYQCLQTVQPLTDALTECNASQPTKVRIVYAFGDFVDCYQENSTPYARNATQVSDVVPLFNNIDDDYDSGPFVFKSDFDWNVDLYARVAKAMDNVIAELDEDKAEPQCIVICTHPKVAVAMRRTVMHDLSVDGKTGDAFVSHLIRQDDKKWTCELFGQPLGEGEKHSSFRLHAHLPMRLGPNIFAHYRRSLYDHFGNNPYRLNPIIYFTMFFFLLTGIFVPAAVGIKLILPWHPQDQLGGFKEQRDEVMNGIGRLTGTCAGVVQITLFLFPPLIAS